MPHVCPVCVAAGISGVAAVAVVAKMNYHRLKHWLQRSRCEKTCVTKPAETPESCTHVSEHVES